MALSPEDIDALEDQHKRIAVVRGKPYPTRRNPDPGPSWECVFRKPSRAEYKRFRQLISNDATRSDAQEQMARACVVYPSPQAFDALLEDWPAIAEAASEKIGELVGLFKDESEKL
jgi:hypothetical protein